MAAIRQCFRNGEEEEMRDRKRSSRPASPGIGGINLSLRFLEDHWYRPINVRDLTAASRMSRRGLFKAFVRQTGRPPGQILRRIRMERAQELLRATEWPLKVIAPVCGFRNVNSFAVAFRRDIGMSPGVYRRSSGQSDDSLDRPALRVAFGGGRRT